MSGNQVDQHKGSDYGMQLGNPRMAGEVKMVGGGGIGGEDRVTLATPSPCIGATWGNSPLTWQQDAYLLYVWFFVYILMFLDKCPILKLPNPKV